MRSERLSSDSSLTLEEASLGGCSVGGSDIGMENSSVISAVVEGSSITATEVFFLNWSKCLRTLLPSVRSTVNEEGPVLGVYDTRKPWLTNTKVFN